MRRLRMLCLLGCFCLPVLLTATGCEEEPKQHTIYREKVIEDKPVKDKDGQPVQVFVVE